MAPFISSSTSWASSPFNRDDGDIIFRSSDLVHFALHKVILVISSPVFADLFSLGQGDVLEPEKSTNGIPIISVPESSTILDLFLRILYPLEKPSVTDLPTIASLLETGRKYQVPSVSKPMSTALNAHLTTDPCRVYAIACRFNMEAYARAAALHAVKMRFQSAFIYVPEMKLITAGSYYRFLYHLRRGSTPVSDAYWGQFSFIERNPNDGVPYKARSSAPLPTPWDIADALRACAADITICSSEGVEFRVHKVIVSVTSPVLKGLVDTGTLKDPQAVIDIAESSHSASELLKCCYGHSFDIPPDPDDNTLVSVCERARLAQKYEVASAITQARLAFRYCLKAGGTSDPLLGYYLAIGLRWPDEAAFAARLAIFDTRKDILSTYIPEMETFSAEVFYNLLKYDDACKTARDAVIKQYQTRTLDNDYYRSGPYASSIRVVAQIPHRNDDKIHLTIAEREIRKTDYCESVNLVFESRNMDAALEKATSQVRCTVHERMMQRAHPAPV